MKPSHQTKETRIKSKYNESIFQLGNATVIAHRTWRRDYIDYSALQNSCALNRKLKAKLIGKIKINITLNQQQTTSYSTSENTPRIEGIPKRVRFGDSKSTSIGSFFE